MVFAFQGADGVILFYHAIATRILTDLGNSHENLIVAGFADLLEGLGGFFAGEDDEDHIHLFLGAVTLQHCKAAVVGFQIICDLLSAIIVGDQLEVGSTEGDLALQRGAEEESRGVADAVKNQEKEIVPQGTD